MAEDEAIHAWSLPAGAVQRVMASRLRPDGTEWTFANTARALTTLGRPTSRQYLSNLNRNGGSPKVDLINALSYLWSVSSEEFRNNDSAGPGGSLIGLVQRANKLDPSKQETLRSKIEREVQRLEINQQGEESDRGQ